MDAIGISRINWLNALTLWNQFHTIEDKYVRELYRDAWKSIPTDAKIVCSDGVVDAFAAALIARSDVFRVMLSGNFAESISNIALPTDSVEDIGDLVQYIHYGCSPAYLHRFKIKYTERAERLFDLAHRFNLKGLEFKTYLYRIKEIVRDSYFEIYEGFDPHEFPGYIYEELTICWPGHERDKILYKIKVDFEDRYSCRVDLILEPSGNAGDNMLNFVADGVELYSCRVPSKYVKACKKMIALITDK